MDNLTNDIQNIDNQTAWGVMFRIKLFNLKYKIRRFISRTLKGERKPTHRITFNEALHDNTVIDVLYLSVKNGINTESAIRLKMHECGFHLSCLNLGKLIDVWCERGLLKKDNGFITLQEMQKNGNQHADESDNNA